MYEINRGQFPVVLMCPVLVLFSIALVSATPRLGASSCETPSRPVYPEQLNTLKIEFRADKSQPWWAPPDCVGWGKQEYAVEMMAIGRFSNPGDHRFILEKIASVSKLVALRYWSVSRDDWAIFIKDSYALSAADKKHRRKDFSIDELAQGAPLYYLQDEATTVGEMIYQMTVSLADEQRILLAVENVTEPTFFGFTLLKKSESQSFYLFEKLQNNEWGYYSLGRLRRTGFGFVQVTDASYANRASSIFRYFAGLPEEALPVYR